MKSVESVVGLGAAAGIGGALAAFGAELPSPIALLFGCLLGIFVGALVNAVWNSQGDGSGEPGQGGGVHERGWQPAAGQPVAGTGVEMSPWTGILMTDRMPEGASHTYFPEDHTSK